MPNQPKVFACLLAIFASLALSSCVDEVKETKEIKDKPIEENGLEIRATEEVVLRIGGTAEVTIALENHNQTPIQTFIPPKAGGNAGCNTCWSCFFEPPIHETMGGHNTFPGVNHDVVATIRPGETIRFTLILERNKDGIFMRSDCGDFGCLDSPIEIPKGIKEVKMFYQHEDSGAEWWSLAGDGDVIQFTETRWIGDLRSPPIVIKLP